MNKDPKIQGRAYQPAIIGGGRYYCSVCGARAYQKRLNQPGDDELCETCFDWWFRGDVAGQLAPLSSRTGS